LWGRTAAQETLSTAATSFVPCLPRACQTCAASAVRPAITHGRRRGLPQRQRGGGGVRRRTCVRERSVHGSRRRRRRPTGRRRGPVLRALRRRERGTVDDEGEPDAHRHVKNRPDAVASIGRDETSVGLDGSPLGETRLQRRRDAVRVGLLRRRHRRHGARCVHRGAADRALAGDVLAQSRPCRQAAARSRRPALCNARLRARADGLLSRRLRHLRRSFGLRGSVDPTLGMRAAPVCPPARDVREAARLAPAWKSTDSGARRRAGVASMAL